MIKNNKIPSVALLGCGYWGKNLARNFHSLGALAAVIDTHPEVQKQARELVPNVPIMEHYEDILSDSTIDAIAIATPAETHVDFGLAAIEAGKDVFIEKPIALNLAEGIRLQKCAEQHEKILMVGHLLEYHPAVLKLREMLQAGELGELNYLYSHRLNFGKIRVEENALWSFAPHDIAVILRLVGELPEEVICTGSSYVTSGIADMAISTLKFRRGIQAHIFVSWLNPFKEQKLTIVGDQKMAVFDDVAEEKLTVYDQSISYDGELPQLNKNGMQAVALDSGEPLRAECEHFLECVANRVQPLTDSENALNVLRVLQACQASLDSDGKPIFINIDSIEDNP